MMIGSKNGFIKKRVREVPFEPRYAIYVPQQTLSTTDSENDTVSVTLQDLATNQVPLTSGITYVNLTFPPAVPGYSRDFFVRMTVTGEVPSVSFMENDGQTPPSFDVADEAWADFSQGVNIIMFTETAQP